MNSLRHQAGISIVELLVGLLIGLFLTGGAIQTFLLTKTSYRFDDALARIQENGRFALDTITRDVRMNGFMGCASFDTSNIDNLIDTGGTGYNANFHDFSQPLKGTNNDQLNGSDSITVQGALDETFLLSADATSFTDNFQVNPGNGISQGNIVAVGDCTTIHIFQVTNNDANATGVIAHDGSVNPGNSASPLNFSKTYATEAQISPLATVAYSLGTGANGEPALFRSLNGTNEELLSGVENLQVVFGEDTDNDGTPNRYVDASSVADMNNVLAVRVSLVVRSFSDNVTEDAQVYAFNGATLTAPDRRIRQVFTSTIRLRN